MRLILAAILITTMNSFSIGQTKKTELQYLVHQPKVKSQKPPLIILLHGVGSNEKDLFSLAGELPDSFLIISVRAPISLGGDGYAWFEVDLSSGTRIINAEHAEESRKKLIKFIGDLKNELSFDEKRIYLCGFSQGGIMSYSVALTRPDLVYGIAVMSGRLLEEVRPLIVPKENLKSLRIFISHGTEDPVIDIAKARSSVAYLKTLDLNPAYKEYKAVHTINNEMLYDLIHWLKQ